MVNAPVKGRLKGVEGVEGVEGDELDEKSFNKKTQNHNSYQTGNAY
jgi:hypothetical protein